MRRHARCRTRLMLLRCVYAYTRHAPRSYAEVAAPPRYVHDTSQHNTMVMKVTYAVHKMLSRARDMNALLAAFCQAAQLIIISSIKSARAYLLAARRCLYCAMMRVTRERMSCDAAMRFTQWRQQRAAGDTRQHARYCVTVTTCY